MATAQASRIGSVDLLHTFKPPLTFTIDSSASPQFTDDDTTQGNSPLNKEGGDWCDDIEGRDAFPVTDNPVPTSVFHPTKEAFWAADPSLCITPEKGPGSRLLTNGKSVRFNPLVEVRRRSDENSHGRDSLNAGYHQDVYKAADASVSSVVGQHITTRTSPSDVTSPLVDAMPFDESLGPISVFASDLQHGQGDIENSGNVLSKSPSPNRGSDEETMRTLPPMSSLAAVDTSGLKSGMSRLQDSVDAVSCVLDQPFEESDALLAKPGFNSSRWVTTELRQLQVNDLNVDRVLRKKLATSSRLRNKIMEKSSSRVNAEGRQFVNLLSVEVSGDELVKTVEQMTAAKVRPGHTAREGKEFTGREPDILEMFTADVQHEAPSLALDALPTLHGCLRTVESMCAFDVIKHVRGWESW